MPSEGFVPEYYVSMLRGVYRKGQHVICDRMVSNDPGRMIPSGFDGTISFVNDDGSLAVLWNDGSSIPLDPLRDDFHVVPW